MTTPADKVPADQLYKPIPTPTARELLLAKVRIGVRIYVHHPKWILVLGFVTGFVTALAHESGSTSEKVTHVCAVTFPPQAALPIPVELPLAKLRTEWHVPTDFAEGEWLVHQPFHI